MKPVCKLSETDGNVFNVIGRVSSVLRREVSGEKSGEFVRKAIACESYDKVLQLCFEYVDVE